MKTFYKIFQLVVFTLMVQIYAHDFREYENSQSKTISRSFTVNSDVELSVNNKYGDIKIETWFKNQIDIQVQIYVTAKKADDAVDRLNDISVDFSDSKSQVSATTNIRNSNRKNLSIEIKYLIKMPEKAKVKLNNMYGNIIGSNFNNETFFTVKYGDLSLGKLNHKINRILMQYASSSKISYINEAVINADYSDLNLGDANKLNMVFKYSNAFFGNVNDLVLEMKYGDLKLNTIDNLSVVGAYSDFNIGTLNNNLTFTGSYGDLSINKLASSFKSLNIKSNYLDSTIGLDSSANFRISASSTYGSVKVPSGTEKSVQNKKGNSESFIGQKGNGKSDIAVSVTYGNINFK